MAELDPALIERVAREIAMHSTLATADRVALSFDECVPLAVAALTAALAPGDTETCATCGGDPALGGPGLLDHRFVEGNFVRDACSFRHHERNGGGLCGGTRDEHRCPDCIDGRAPGEPYLYRREDVDALRDALEWIAAPRSPASTGLAYNLRARAREALGLLPEPNKGPML